MRAITVRQPWAWAIIHGHKDVENRSANIAGAYRGPVAIHAAKAVDEGAFTDFRLAAANVAAEVPLFGPGDVPEPLPVGVFVGVVDLVSVHKQHGVNTGEPRPCCGSVWGDVGSFHLGLANPRPLPGRPIEARGFLGLWSPARHTADALRAAVDLA